MTCSAGRRPPAPRLKAAATLLLVLILSACERPRPPAPTAEVPPLPPPSAPVSAACAEPLAFQRAAAINAGSLRGLAWEPYRRAEVGWETYAPVVAKEIGTSCPPDSAGFAAALARWQASRALPVDGLFNGVAFQVIKGLWQERRPFVMATLEGACPDAPDESALIPAGADEVYGGKAIALRPGALDAYRRLRAAALAEAPDVAADPQALTIFSGFRAPAADEARCALEGNCTGVTRARCSAHRTGLALDLHVGAAPGYRPDQSADENRRFMSQTAAYRWLVVNAGRFGFVNYVFEPWHWEWTGEPPLPQTRPWPPAPAPMEGTLWPSEPLSPGSPVAESPDVAEKPDRRRLPGGAGRVQPGPDAKPPAKARAHPDRVGDRTGGGAL